MQSKDPTQPSQSTAAETPVELLDMRLRELEGRLEDLKAQAGEKEAEAQARYQQQLESLHQRKQALEQEISARRESASSAWNALKRRIQQGLENLKHSLERTASRPQKQ